MPSDTLERLLDRLDQAKLSFDQPGRAQSYKLLSQIEKRRVTDPSSLIRLHETLLFMRAYPQGVRVLKRVEKILGSFSRRVLYLKQSGADLSLLGAVEVSGIAETFVEDTFSYQITRWLVRRFPSQVSINWELHDDEYRLAAVWPRFLPFLEEDALVEANVPYLDWLRAAKRRNRNELGWLIERFERLRIPEKEKAELYESLKLYVRWELADSRATRTRMKQPVKKIFYHTAPLLRRRDVSLAREFHSEPIPLKELSRAQGEAVLDLARETSTIRYRELYGFTHGDVSSVRRADIGRGVDVFIVGLQANHRLPLRAYHAGLIFKNGIPVCYVEGLTIFERMEIGFNVYYTFREGESGWIYARVLKMFRQMLNVTTFYIDPYQLGHQNEEGIESGAFWFYRKLGFRPTAGVLAKILKAEEEKLASRPSYRTRVSILQQLAIGHMVLESDPGSASGSWDHFQIRNIGLAVQRQMARDFDGDASRIRRGATKRVEVAFGIRTEDLKEGERNVFEDLALVLNLVPDLENWTEEEKRDVVLIIRAKASPDESRYVRLLQGHLRLRDEIIRIGSSGRAP